MTDNKSYETQISELTAENDRLKSINKKLKENHNFIITRLHFIFQIIRRLVGITNGGFFQEWTEVNYVVADLSNTTENTIHEVCNLYKQV